MSGEKTFKGTAGDWRVFDHYCGRDPVTAGEYANTRLIGLSQFHTIAEVRHGSTDVSGDVDANAQLLASAKPLLAASQEIDRLSLVIDSAVRFSDSPENAKLVKDALNATRAAISQALGGEA